MKLSGGPFVAFSKSYDTGKVLSVCDPKSLLGSLAAMFLLLIVPAHIPPLARHGDIDAHWYSFGLFVCGAACSYTFYRLRGRGTLAQLLTAADTLLAECALSLAVVTTQGHVRYAYAVLQGLVLIAAHSRYYGLTWVYSAVLAFPLLGIVSVAVALFGVEYETLLLSVCMYLFALWVSNLTRMERAAARKSDELRRAVVASDTVATQSLELALTRTALTIGGTLHELRNHLGVIGAGLQFLKDNPDDPERHAALSDSLDSYATARNVLEESIGKLRRSKDQPATRFDAVRLLRELDGDGAERGVKLAASGDADSFLVRGDEEGLRSVMTNLTRNAARAGATNVRVAWRLETAGKALRIDVSDDGPGIPPDLEADLFKPFASRTKGGTGLGLYLSRRQLELMGGTISLSSKPGEGACFSLVLPGRAGSAGQGA